ncbi:hypothetical protein H1Q59_05965 [Holosporaceae bacterium 'Namur']|nr:hypothetical protein [Holosporaceae bacterium 'Namur']
MKNFIIMLVFIFSIPNAFAKEIVQASQDPISIESDELIIEQKENKGVFTGNVEVIQGDMVINSDKMIVYYAEPATDNTDSQELLGSNKISRIETFGNVVITTPKEKAKGEKGEYITKDQVFILKKNVQLIQGKNILTGNKFIYNRLNGKGVLTSGVKGVGKNKQRAKALIIPEQVK